MPVAKTYKSYPIDGEPFKEKGKWYVTVQTKSGLKKVRWYSDTEYKRMYPDEVKDIMDFNARHAFGFDEAGYITIYKGNVERWIEDVGRDNIYYNCTFLYYTPSKLTTPALNNDVQAIKLTWNEVKKDDTRMKSHEEVSAYVTHLLSDNDVGQSEYQGDKDSWLTKKVTIRKKTTKETTYGTKHTFTMEDSENNIYVWETGAKDYSCDETVSLKMKVKEHKEINGVKTTIVWYCKEI